MLPNPYLAVFPCFAADAADGASRFVTQWLASLDRVLPGGQVLATTARHAVSTSAWSCMWPDHLPDEPNPHTGPAVSRYRHQARLPTVAWRVLTRIGLVWMGRSASRIDPTARAWPFFLQRLILAGHGPYSDALLTRCTHDLKQSRMLMTGYGPLGLAVAVAERARRARRPIAVLPLMHADDPLHHLPVLLDHLRAADQVLALTEFEAAHIRTLTGHSEVHVIGGGVNLDELEAPHVSGARFRQRHGLGSGPLALYLGRKESGKRYPLALEAVRRSANPDLRLVLIGPDVDGVPVSEPRAVYLGPRPREEVLDALDACDVLINPSTSESFGLTVLEAWARRKPVIVNAQCGPFRAIVRDGQDGLWAGDSAAMTRALDRLLADPVLAIRLGLAGRARLADYFNWPATAARTQAAIQGR